MLNFNDYCRLVTNSSCTNISPHFGWITLWLSAGSIWHCQITENIWKTPTSFKMNRKTNWVQSQSVTQFSPGFSSKEHFQVSTFGYYLVWKKDLSSSLSSRQLPCTSLRGYSSSCAGMKWRRRRAGTRRAARWPCSPWVLLTCFLSR